MVVAGPTSLDVVCLLIIFTLCYAHRRRTTSVDDIALTLRSLRHRIPPSPIRILQAICCFLASPPLYSITHRQHYSPFIYLTIRRTISNYDLTLIFRSIRLDRDLPSHTSGIRYIAFPIPYQLFSERESLLGVRKGLSVPRFRSPFWQR